MELKELIENAWDNRELLQDKEIKIAIKTIIDDLDQGTLRVAQPNGDGWHVNEWVKKAVILYFPIQNMQSIEVGPFEFHDKMKLKTGYDKKGIRVYRKDDEKHVKPNRHQLHSEQQERQRVDDRRKMLVKVE